MKPFGRTKSGEFILPAEAATQKFAFLARSGAGKTYGATKLAEELYQDNVQIVALDPVGVWYGLRLAANGRGQGLQIPVFGGEYGDIPLEPGAGALIADLIVDRHISVILDVSGFRKSQRKEFVTAFAEQLFHRKKTARSPMHLFLEEAQFFIPQKTFKGEERMLGAFEDIGKVGRNYGIGLTLISQRPQAVNKDVLNQVEALFVLQMNAAQERKAIRDWIDAQGIDAAAAVDELPKLEIGEAYVWSPQWLKFFGKIKINSKWTYNASATPTFDTASVTPKPLSENDLQILRTAMQEVTSQAEANNPAILRRRIAELERQIKQTAHVTVKPERIVERVEVPVLTDEQIKRLEQAVQGITDAGTLMASIAQELQAALQSFTRVPALPIQQPANSVQEPRPQPRPRAHRNGTVPETPRHTRDAVPQLRSGERRILETLAQRYPGKVTKAQLATLSRFSVRGGTFNTYLSTLRRANFMDERGGEISITQAGLDYLGHDVPAPQTTQELLEMWRGALRAGERRMFDVLLEIYPEALPRTQLADLAGYEASGGTFSTYLSTLRRNGLIEDEAGQVRASEHLFV